MAERAVDRSVRASNLSVVNLRDWSAIIGRVGSVSREREQQCYRCGKQRNKKNVCRWALEVCFGCGQTGHIVSDCVNCAKNGHYARMCKEPLAKCVECGMEGHVVSNGCTSYRVSVKLGNVTRRYEE
ncbi:CCHC-type zinc finger nucleic acid binding protein-like [Macrobrachium nipponense]|uniref:CCHC-type zinc finger nucleic acid binding protein-like n=1 Tax=Macrobrachium nipponense TaxID=159736 RepID=UPI0030C87777